jgi:hypothetical protein
MNSTFLVTVLKNGFRRWQMDVRAIFGIDMLMSLTSSVVAAALYVWPRLQGVEKNRALSVLVTPHMFFRFIGLSFLVPGVVSPSLPSAFAVPVAYGDLVAGILAIIAAVALARRAALAHAAVWLFNIWGAVDFIVAFYQGLHGHLDPGALGASFFIVTVFVLPLLVTHGLIFGLLMRR